MPQTQERHTQYMRGYRRNKALEELVEREAHKLPVIEEYLKFRFDHPRTVEHIDVTPKVVTGKLVEHLEVGTGTKVTKTPIMMDGVRVGTETKREKVRLVDKNLTEVGTYRETETIPEDFKPIIDRIREFCLRENGVDVPALHLKRQIEFLLECYDVLDLMAMRNNQEIEWLSRDKKHLLENEDRWSKLLSEYRYGKKEFNDFSELLFKCRYHVSEVMRAAQDLHLSCFRYFTKEQVQIVMAEETFRIMKMITKYRPITKESLISDMRTAEYFIKAMSEKYDGHYEPLWKTKKDDERWKT